MVHTRELCNQIAVVYQKITKGTGITVANFNETCLPAQIVIATHGKVESVVSGRRQMDLSQLKCMIIDEADVFFLDDKNFELLLKVANSKYLRENDAVQWILFSATYPPEDNHKYERVQERMASIVQKAQQIKIRPEKLKLSHIHQYKKRVGPK